METVHHNSRKERLPRRKRSSPQTIPYFSRESDLPLTIVFLVDTSNSEPCAFGGPRCRRFDERDFGGHQPV